MSHRKEIISAIERAFEHVEYPGDDNIVRDFVNDPEDMKEAFIGKSWREISVQVMYNFRLDLLLFTPKAFRYYLPAFLIASLKPTFKPLYFGEITEYVFISLVPLDSFVNTFPPDALSTLTKDFFERVEGLDEPQKTAIKKFLFFYLKNDPREKELFGTQIEQYWGRLSDS